MLLKNIIYPFSFTILGDVAFERHIVTLVVHDSFKFLLHLYIILDFILVELVPPFQVLGKLMQANLIVQEEQVVGVGFVLQLVDIYYLLTTQLA